MIGGVVQHVLQHMSKRVRPPGAERIRRRAAAVVAGSAAAQARYVRQRRRERPLGGAHVTDAAQLASNGMSPNIGADPDLEVGMPHVMEIVKFRAEPSREKEFLATRDEAISALLSEAFPGLKHATAEDIVVA